MKFANTQKSQLKKPLSCHFCWVNSACDLKTLASDQHITLKSSFLSLKTLRNVNSPKDFKIVWWPDWNFQLMVVGVGLWTALQGPLETWGNERCNGFHHKGICMLEGDCSLTPSFFNFFYCYHHILQYFVSNFYVIETITKFKPLIYI